MRRLWSASDVRPMELDQVRFGHVARHLYQSDEKWEQVIPALGNAGAARDRACKAGCAEALLEAPHPDCDRCQPSCRAHVLQDHDALLAPAYLNEVSRAEHLGQVGALPRKEGSGPGWAFVGEGGVMVIVREVGRLRRPEVKTAYRVVPKKGHSPESFLKEALHKLSDKTLWKA
ncbi:hypothetical protein OV208_37390 [Corallococcus sp. bb12-1]|uniref:hypothetical protein n=1 Tax=Corallococcus sp. bb12-1 TaxID=2996784 RepID=UPI0022708878|nr:hypothetical protein [Corallococcus sp. bb12-1]MCY1047036.1 hypothetical protein [Corallococcus sp. bb12-1]